MKEQEKLDEKVKNDIPEPSSSIALELFIFIHNKIIKILSNYI